jgi:uncharacterized membrane protein
MSFSPNSDSQKIAVSGLSPAIVGAVVTLSFTAPTAGGTGADIGAFAGAASGVTERDDFVAAHLETTVDFAALDTSYDLLVADLALIRAALVSINTAFETIAVQTTV